eukprot:TRINITY_DN3794_c0_g2_i2.p1 TRINITY_DN3794_c0_g2~~TRINITY_DN3794_c0_g2_i2.p1  ORF type:complete len:320 (+),score=51.76 TRINITY_DN3794_c0_g2_i2:84-962(+)
MPRKHRLSSPRSPPKKAKTVASTTTTTTTILTNTTASDTTSPPDVKTTTSTLLVDAEPTSTKVFGPEKETKIKQGVEALHVLLKQHETHFESLYQFISNDNMKLFMQATELLESLTAKTTSDSEESESLELVSMSSAELTNESAIGNLKTLCDIDPQNFPLIQRWNANREFRESGLEKKFAQLVLGPEWRKRYFLMLEGKCPLGFDDEKTWNDFVEELGKLLQSEHITGYFGLRGTSVTFMSLNPNKGFFNTTSHLPVFFVSFRFSPAQERNKSGNGSRSRIERIEEIFMLF